jgi:L-ascorbate metabolism protein UlaG (beta-lactamase superfamily)
LVETPERVGLFDPGYMSDVSISSLSRLDDLIITHEHGDHLNVDCVRALLVKFPDAQVWASAVVMNALEAASIGVKQPINTKSVTVFKAPHAAVEPLFPAADNIGVHYLDQLTHPGDSFTFDESRAVLALPVAAPWGATTEAVDLAMRLKPKVVLPVHDWHWSDPARKAMYERLEAVFSDKDIHFIGLENGAPVEISK